MVIVRARPVRCAGKAVWKSARTSSAHLTGLASGRNDDHRLKEQHPDLAALTEWAVEARYPGNWLEATEADATAAVQQARAVWTSVDADLAQHGFDKDLPD